MVHELMDGKKELIDKAFQNTSYQSFADLGGVWGVEGGYTFYGLDHNPRITHAYLYDYNITEIVKTKAKNYPQLHLIEKDFRFSKTIDESPKIDVIYMFYILNHQVHPHWDEVLRRWAKKAKCLIIYGTQWLTGDKSVRLIDLGKEGYFNAVPKVLEYSGYKDLFTEKHYLVKDDVNIWQWGITNHDLRAVMKECGFVEKFVKPQGVWPNNLFQDYAFMFVKE